jgi:hypothetical protein
MTSMTNANQFQDYVRQRESYTTASTFSIGSYITPVNAIKDTARLIEKEDEEITQALPDTHIFDPEDLFL